MEVQQRLLGGCRQAVSAGRRGMAGRSLRSAVCVRGVGRQVPARGGSVSSESPRSGLGRGGAVAGSAVRGGLGRAPAGPGGLRRLPEGAGGGGR